MNMNTKKNNKKIKYNSIKNDIISCQHMINIIDDFTADIAPLPWIVEPLDDTTFDMLKFF